MKIVVVLFGGFAGAAVAASIACGGESHTGGAGSGSRSGSGIQDGGRSSTGTAGGNASTTGIGSGGGSGSGGVQGNGGGTEICASNADCPPNMGCGFKISDGCSAVGACLNIEVGGGACDAGGPLACTCNGAIVSGWLCNYPDGFLPYPVRHEGSCTGDSGAD